MGLKNRLFLIFLILMVLLSVSVVCATENTTVEQTDELAPLSAIQTPIDQSPELDDFGTEDSMDDNESTDGQNQNNILRASNKDETPLRASAMTIHMVSDGYVDRYGYTFNAINQALTAIKNNGAGGTIFLDGGIYEATGSAPVDVCVTGYKISIYGGYSEDDGISATLDAKRMTRGILAQGTAIDLELKNIIINNGYSGIYDFEFSPLNGIIYDTPPIGAGLFAKTKYLVLSNVVINNSKATTEGAGVGALIGVIETALIENSCIMNSVYSAPGGGGIGLEFGGAGLIINCSFINNTCPESRSVAGGGVQAKSNSAKGGLIITNCTFKDNLLTPGNKYTSSHGAALCMVNNFVVANSTFINNLAGLGGALGVHNDGTIFNCTFINNTATKICGGGIYTGLDSDNIKVTIDQCYFEGNQAPKGGAIQLKGNNIHVVNSTFINNSAIQGGGCYIQGQNTIIENSTFDGNKATHNLDPRIKPVTTINTEDGGAVYIGRVSSSTTSDNAKIFNNTFSENNAVNGAGVFIEGKNTIIQNNTFDSNTATDGAGAYINGVNANIQGNIFEDNTAVNGAGAYVKSSGAQSTTGAKVISNNFTGNNVTGKGGACYIEGDYSRFTGNDFTYNNAIPQANNDDVGLGGAVYVKGSNTNSNSNSFEFNTARNGSAVYTDGSNFNLVNDKFFKNQAYSYFLVTTAEPEDSIHKTSDVLVTIVHVGGDNILNAIHNTKPFNQIRFQNVTYIDFYGNTKTTGSGMTQPLDGPLNSNNGTLVYQYDREAYQDIHIVITDEEGNVTYNGTLKTDIFGTVELLLDKLSLKPGVYSVYAEHPEDWNYKFIMNTTSFRINAIPVTPGKTVSNPTPNYGDIITYNLTVKNTADVVYSDNIYFRRYENV